MAVRSGITTKGGREEEADLTLFLGEMPSRRRLEMCLFKSDSLSFLVWNGERFKSDSLSLLVWERERLKSDSLSFLTLQGNPGKGDRLSLLIFLHVVGWLTFTGL